MRTPKMVPVTFADPRLVSPLRYTFSTHSERRQFYARNARLLADKLETLPPGLHNQKSWTTCASNECGTTACALGWAALSHAVPGLQYMYDGSPGNYSPTVNGLPHTWESAGELFFGETIANDVFYDTGASLDEVITKLRERANSLES